MTLKVSAESTAGLLRNDFSDAFSKLLEKAKTSCYEIAKFSGVSEPYLNRLRRGEKVNPSIEIVMRIALALVHFGPNISLSDIEDLLVCSQRKWDNQAWEISDTLRDIALFPGNSIVVPSFF